MDDRMELTLIINTLAFTLIYLFLLGKRLKLARLQRAREEVDWEPEIVLPSSAEVEPVHAR